ncbi:MAG: cation-transporting P-type ATPase, partial [Ktedonobacteraceae bacterium]
MPDQPETRLTALTAEAAAAEGLTSQEAAERLQRSGPNTVAEEAPHRLQAFLKKFWSPIPGMLELAIMLELILGHQTEALIIAALLLFNALLGFSQETLVQRALALLHQRLAIQARVRRDGRWQVLPAAELVSEDVVHLRMGDVVPADLRLTDGQLLVDQSILTGESLPMER